VGSLDLFREGEEFSSLVSRKRGISIFEIMMRIEILNNYRLVRIRKNFENF